MKKEHSGIAIVIGTKAELIKCVPVMVELQKQKKDYWFIHTGQHPLSTACEEFNVKQPDFVLSVEPKISTKFWSKINKISLIWFLSMITKIRRKIREIKPRHVIYHGDTMSTAAASIASSKFLNLNKKWKNAHLEAGLRSGRMFEPFPEEISRRISDRFSDILLAVSDLSERNLRNENKQGKIVKSGNTIVDSAIITLREAKKKYKKKNGEYALINLHRHENLTSKERMEKMIKILSNIKINTIWPMHDNTEYYLKKYNLLQRVKSLKNIEIRPLVNYFEFIFLLANCKYIVTDGGSIQEESLVFKKPCILLRKKTERQEGLSTGINFLTGLNVNYAKKVIENIEGNKIKVKKFENPYGELGLSKKIVELLK
jgi:UDP-N-acetylglucosamine 2-epimerase (non-hydrolysing)